MTQEKKQELTLRISQANKTQMITILYEMVIEYLSDSRDAISLGEKELSERYLTFAQSCIEELIRSVNRSVELGRNLHETYIFSKKELLLAGITGNIHRIWKVENNFKSLHDAYLEIENTDTSGQVMGNTQAVYAGLTYGRHSLNEAVAAGQMNRGFMA